MAINGDKFYNELTELGYKGIHDNNADSDEFKMVNYNVDYVSYFYLKNELYSLSWLLKDDNVLYQVINDLIGDRIDSLPNNQPKNNCSNQNDVNQEFIDHVLEAVSQTSSRLGDFHRVKAKYKRLVDLKNGLISKRTRRKEFDLQFVPNIDGEDAVCNPRTQTMNNFRQLFCRRCFRYRCFLHDTNQTNIQIQQYDIKPAFTPCNRNCFLNLDHVQHAIFKQTQVHPSELSNKKSISNKSTEVQQVSSHSSSNELSSENSNSNESKQQADSENGSDFEMSIQNLIQTADQDENSNPTVSKMNDLDVQCDCGEWSSAEQSLLRCLLDVYKNVDNFCCIAEAMPNKCCFHIYKYTSKNLMSTDLEKNFLIYSDFNLIGKEVTKKKDAITSKSRYKKKKSKNLFISSTFRKQIANDDTNVFQYVPCDHPGRPCNEDCICLKSNGFCEKYCNCDLDCPQRFPGCRCKAQCNTRLCPCYLAVRECDVDLCGSCGASAFNLSLNDLILV